MKEATPPPVLLKEGEGPPRVPPSRYVGAISLFQKVTQLPPDTTEHRQVIDLALATLSDELRLAVTLRDLQGLEYKEIAAALDVPIGTVESRIFRAREKLKPLLAPLLRTANHEP